MELGKILNLLKQQKFALFWLLLILVPVILSLREIILGTFSFWFDPARDLLLAWNNLHKPTLIGQPTGIPGLFYGPYWIWILSLALIFSKDVRWVHFLVSFIPYFVVFPLFLRRFDHIWGKTTSLVLWLFFIVNYRSYSSSLWNPQLAPLLFLILAYLLVIKHSQSKLRYFLVGVTSVLIVSLHFSFGIACFMATFMFLFLETIVSIKKQKQVVGKRMKLLTSFALGVFITNLPFLIFELRHNFLQIKVLLSTVTNGILFQVPAVGQTGLSKTDILNETLEKLTDLVQIPVPLLAFFGIVMTLVLVMRKQEKTVYMRVYYNLFFYSLLVLMAILSIFLTSKNPVWEYHFIAVEVVFLLLVGLLLSKSKLLTYLALFWGLVIMLIRVNYTVSALNFDLRTMSSFATKLFITEQILVDAPQNFGVHAYSSAIYTYDFDYLFLWQTERFHKNQDTRADVVYLIIPSRDEDIITDFIHYKTPDTGFETSKTWQIPDGTTIIKRQKISKTNQ